MTASIELQVISFILTSNDTEAVNTLLEYDTSYYAVLDKQIAFIQKHFSDTGKVPDKATFQFQFPDFVIIQVNEPLTWLVNKLKANKRQIMLISTFNKIKDLGEGDADDAWEYLDQQCTKVNEMSGTNPMNIVRDVDERMNQVLEYSKQTRIPTGFDEIDKCMYGGMSTVEELLLIEARLNTGKSWVCTRLMESAQAHGFNVTYYSPEMQASYLATRFDTWRGHFANSQLFQGKYSEEYITYMSKLKQQYATDNIADAYIIENKDAPDNEVTVPFLRKFVKKNKIKLLIIDGLSYMIDSRAKRNDNDTVKYKNICEDLFAMSKECGCAIAVAVQANRATKDSKDEKGEPFPNLYNIEGSDHPARIATQVFAIRQIFEKHILDIRLEKSRNAQNQKPMFSYNWDINTGAAAFIPNTEDLPAVNTPVVNSGLNTPDISGLTSSEDFEDDIDLEAIEF